MDQQKTYDVVGLSCANCANKFERKLNQLPSVEKATVNFGASKIYVTGDPTIEELNKAGAFENLDVKLETKTAVQTEEESATLNEQWWQQVIAFYHHHYPICFATLLVVLGY
ncbi:heavy-metal-associated domain-containing protein, partial [Staphylococcus equorum]